MKTFKHHEPGPTRRGLRETFRCGNIIFVGGNPPKVVESSGGLTRQRQRKVEEFVHDTMTEALRPRTPEEIAREKLLPPSRRRELMEKIREILSTATYRR